MRSWAVCWKAWAKLLRRMTQRHGRQPRPCVLWRLLQPWHASRAAVLNLLACS